MTAITPEAILKAHTRGICTDCSIAGVVEGPCRHAKAGPATRPAPPGFALPWQVRYARAWWLREARYNIRVARHGEGREGLLRLAAECRTYARNIRGRWLERGTIPVVGPRSEAEAFPMPPHPEDGIS